MAQALPSFVDLLASLDLESEEISEVQRYAPYPTSPSFVSSSPSSSLPSLSSAQTSPRRFLASPHSTTSFAAPSPSIVISQPSPVDDTLSIRRRSISNRYNPYVPPSVFARRRSLPGDLTDHLDNVQKQPDATRACSSSPPIRRASLGDSSNEPSTRLSRRPAITQTDQPISALVRRRQPHSSPPGQSFNLSKTTRRSASPPNPLTPVSLPSLPPLPPISVDANPSSSAFSDFSRLPPITVLDRRSSTPSRSAGPSSRATSRTPRSSSPNPSTGSSPDAYRRSRDVPYRGHSVYGRPASS